MYGRRRVDLMDNAALVPDERCHLLGCQSIVDAIARKHYEVVHIVLDLEGCDLRHSDHHVGVPSIALELRVRVPYRSRDL